MNPIKSQWYAVEEIEPPRNIAVLCFNGRTFIGIWDGTTWCVSHFDTDPNGPPPTHWRELPNVNTDE